MTQAKKSKSKTTEKEQNVPQKVGKFVNTEEKKKAPQNKTALNLQKRYLELSPRDQLGVTNFFNLHNAAHFVYDGLSEAAQQYVAYCIRLSNNAVQVEAKNSAQVE